jgi:hypothetical protein
MHILDRLKDAFYRLVRHKSACTILAFRKSYLTKFFLLTLAFLSEVLLKSVDAIVIMLKSRPERSRLEKFRLVRCAIHFIKKQLFNFCYRDICHFSHAVRFIPRPLLVTDSRNLDKFFSFSNLLNSWINLLY